MGNDKTAPTGNDPIAQLLATKYNVDFKTAAKMAEDMKSTYDRTNATASVTGYRTPIDPATRQVTEEAAGNVGINAADQMKDIVARVKHFAKLHDQMASGQTMSPADQEWYQQAHQAVLGSMKSNAPAGAQRGPDGSPVLNANLDYMGKDAKGNYGPQFDRSGKPYAPTVQMQQTDAQGRPVMPTVNMGTVQPTTNSWGQLAGDEITPDQVVAAWQNKQVR